MSGIRMTTAHSANREWLNMLQALKARGSYASPRGLRTRELLGYQTVIDMKRCVTNIRPKLGYKFLFAEAHWILTGRNDVASITKFSPHIAKFSNDGRFFDGAYGPRIVDQLRYIVDCLDRDEDTRQAVLEIWRPNPRDSKDIPCTISVQFLLRREPDADGGMHVKLHCMDTMRSSDAWLGWPYDVFNFSMLTAYVALLLASRKPFCPIELGNLHLTAGSQHYYVNPKGDGVAHIPYTESDIDEVLASVAGKSLPACEPLDLTRFAGPEDLIEMLAAGPGTKYTDDLFHWPIKDA